MTTIDHYFYGLGVYMANWTASGWSCGRHPHHDRVATLRDRGCSMSKTLYIVVEHVPIAEPELGRGPKHRPGSNGYPVPMLKKLRSVRESVFDQQTRCARGA